MAVRVRKKEKGRPKINPCPHCGHPEPMVACCGTGDGASTVHFYTAYCPKCHITAHEAPKRGVLGAWNGLTDEDWIPYDQAETVKLAYGVAADTARAYLSLLERKHKSRSEIAALRTAERCVRESEILHTAMGMDGEELVRILRRRAERGRYRGL